MATICIYTTQYDSSNQAANIIWLGQLYIFFLLVYVINPFVIVSYYISEICGYLVLIIERWQDKVDYTFKPLFHSTSFFRLPSVSVFQFHHLHKLLRLYVNFQKKPTMELTNSFLLSSEHFPYTKYLFCWLNRNISFGCHKRNTNRIWVNIWIGAN